MNPTDIGLRQSGDPGHPPPWVPGMDAAGVVESVGYVGPLARERGLRVIADAKPEDERLVRGFGADVVVPCGESFAEAVRAAVPDGVEGVFDTALLGRAALPVIRDRGGMAVVRGWNEGAPERGVQIQPVAVRSVLERTDWLEELRWLASARRLSLRVAAEYPPEDVAEAQRARAAGGLRGRAVIVF